MTSATTRKPIQRIDRLNEGEWLHRLLADVQKQVASGPSPQAVARIRQRLFSEIGTPVQRAARVAA